jgi:hypothetical protein
MLLPALANAKNRAQATIDLNNNKQLLIAGIMYSGDANEILPGCGWGTADPCWAHGANLAPLNGSQTALQFPNYQSNQINFARKGQLFPYIKTEKIFMCPADKPDALFYQRNVEFTSYVWNGALNGYGHAPATASFKITQFKPLDILQWEADGATPFWFNDCSSFPDEGISPRHGKGATVGLISGSTQRLLVRDWYSNRYAGTKDARGANIPRGSLPNQVWCNPGKTYGTENF